MEQLIPLIPSILDFLSGTGEAINLQSLAEWMFAVFEDFHTHIDEIQGSLVRQDMLAESRHHAAMARFNLLDDLIKENQSLDWARQRAIIEQFEDMRALIEAQSAEIERLSQLIEGKAK